MILRTFGASVGPGAHPYPSARIWAPWNLVMEEGTCLADGVDCYCVDRVILRRGSTVSQRSFLCTASRDYRKPGLPVVTGPIDIGANAWVAAEVFIGPGVTIGANSIIGARSSVFRDVLPNCVAMGIPAVAVKERPASHG